MSAQNPTVEDLRTVAHNLQAEGQNSRAEVINNAANIMGDLLKACEWAARSEHHPKCKSRRQGEMRCNCHVKAAQEAVEKAKR